MTDTTERRIPPLIEAVELRRHYVEGSGTVTALDGVSFTIGASELVAVLGPSGSGKSTMLHQLGALDSLDSGRLTVNGIRVDELDQTGKTRFRREHVGFVFQSFFLVSYLTVAENIALSAIVGNRPERAWRPRTVELLDRLGIADLSRRYPHELSGGQRQRVAVARATYSRPTILLADEPTGNLDTAAGAAVLGLLREAVSEDRCGLLVTHDIHAAATADRVFAFRDGRIVAEFDTRAPGDQEQRGGSRVDRVRDWYASAAR